MVAATGVFWAPNVRHKAGRGLVADVTWAYVGGRPFPSQPRAFAFSCGHWCKVMSIHPVPGRCYLFLCQHKLDSSGKTRTGKPKEALLAFPR